MTNSRNKGASFERRIANDLLLLTGVSFKRDLEQYRAADHGDLIPDDPAWPFVIECKAYAAGVGCKNDWIAQVEKSSAALGKMPAVIWKYNNRPVRVTVPFRAIAAAHDAEGTGPDEWADVTLEGFAWMAAEIMAWRA